MNRDRTHRQIRERQRRRNGRIVVLAVFGWVTTLILWPVVGICILAGWVILELIGA